MTEASVPPTMLKYLVAFAVFFGLAIYISIQDKHAAQNATQNTAHANNDVVIPATGPEVNEKHPQEHIENPEGNSPSWYGFFRWPNGTTTWAIILTLFAIAEQTRQTAKAAKAAEVAVQKADQTLASQKDSTKRQLRAYIAVQDAKVIFHEDGKLEASLKLHNCGQTPAYELKGAHTPGFSSYPIPDVGIPPDDIRKSVSLLGADNSLYILAELTQLKGATLSRTIDELSRPDFLFFLAGYFTYRDIFKDEHFIRFQLILGGPSGPLRWDTDEKGVRFAILCNDSVGNEAD